MIHILRILFFLISLPCVFIIIPYPNNSIDSLKLNSLQDDYNLAKEYYYFKTKNSYEIKLESSTDDNEDKFIKFAKSYEKNYRIFESNWFRINNHNFKNSYKLKLNKFADQVDFNDKKYHSDLMSKTISYKTDNQKSFFYKIQEIYKNLFSSFPKEIDWRKTNYLTGVKNQKNCGSCWAFSTTSALESFLRSNNLNVGRLSEQELVDCSTENYGCQGGLMDKAFDYCINNNGLHSDKNYPYSATNNKCLSGCSINNNTCTTIDKVNGTSDFIYRYTEPYSVNSLKEALIKNPVSIAINANTPNFRFYSEGVIEDDLDVPSELNHAVLLVGYKYDKKGLYWIIQNSWVEDWGDQGFVKIRSKEGEGVLSCQIYGVYPVKNNDK